MSLWRLTTNEDSALWHLTSEGRVWRLAGLWCVLASCQGCIDCIVHNNNHSQPLLVRCQPDWPVIGWCHHHWYRLYCSCKLRQLKVAPLAHSDGLKRSDPSEDKSWKMNRAEYNRMRYSGDTNNYHRSSYRERSRKSRVSEICLASVIYLGQFLSGI